LQRVSGITECKKVNGLGHKAVYPSDGSARFGSSLAIRRKMEALSKRKNKVFDSWHPDFVVEVMSPSDNLKDLRGKMVCD
jgi:Uma2 family endonuclease